MKRILCSLMFCCLLGLSQPVLSAKPIPVLNAHAAILMDQATGKVLYAKNSRAIMAPASTTKIMTAVLVLEQLNLNRTVRVGDVSWEGTSLNLVRGERKTVLELLYGLMLVSGNDAASVLAKTIAGTETAFARLMTEKARLIGMRNTVFKNASGLPVIGHYTTAYDLAILTRFAMRKPTFQKIVKTKYFKISGSKPGTVRNLKNHNKLLWKYHYTTGVKTGYTVNAGGCLVASASYQGRSLIAVVLKTKTIYDDCIKLFKYGFS
ncbi:MAG TPA: D-alanyl-D-alanine carboxypeptidase family protein [Bacillota bacterium]